MNKISFLVGLKNNLDYTKYFYHTTRESYPDNEIVLVSYGSTDGTHKWLESLQDDNLKFFFSEEGKTLSDTYNKAIEIATNPFVVFLHNDMVLGKAFLNSLQEYLDSNKILYYALIEPPIFKGDYRDWKSIEDFGEGIENFDKSGFWNQEEKLISDISRKGISTSSDVSFFLCAERQKLLQIGGLDPLFSPMFCEDDDFVIRLRLFGLGTFVVKNAIVYHFVSKTSRFSEEYKTKTQQIEEKSQRNFVRKWGFYNFSKSKAKYNIGIVLKNGTFESVKKIEPHATIVYTDFTFENYILQEQPNTLIHLKDRILPISNLKQHDIMVYLDGNHINKRTEDQLRNLSDKVTEKIVYQDLKDSFFRNIYNAVFRKHIPKIIITTKQPKRLENTLVKKKL